MKIFNTVILGQSRDQKWGNWKHWSPLQSLCALFTKSDVLSTVVADACTHHTPLIISVIKENGPAASQAAELLHTVRVENFAITSRILKILIEDIKPICSLDSELSFDSICSIGIVSILEVNAK